MNWRDQTKGNILHLMTLSSTLHSESHGTVHGTWHRTWLTTVASKASDLYRLGWIIAISSGQLSIATSPVVRSAGDLSLLLVYAETRM